MKDNLKYLIKILCRFFLRIFYVFPIKDNNILFMSTMGKSYSCNPKYLFKSMLYDERFKDFNFIWVFKNPKEYDKFLNYNNVNVIKKTNYLLYFYYLLTSKFIIYNCGGFSYAPIRKQQYLIETWHGGGAYKTCGFMTGNKSKSSKKGIEMATTDIKLFLSSSRISSEMFIEKCMHYSGEILNSGLPRNDILFSKNGVEKTIVKKNLGIEENDKVVLYAPTFKGTEEGAVNIDNDFEILDICRLKSTLISTFGGNWKIFTRGHQYANSIFLKGCDGDLSNYPDMQELLLITDILITDYSSSIWDFSLTNKLCVLFVPDIERYISSDRAFLTDIKTWPGLIAKDNNELEKLIKNYDIRKYNEKIEKYLKNSSSYESGCASDIVKDKIISEYKKV